MNVDELIIQLRQARDWLGGNGRWPVDVSGIKREEDRYSKEAIELIVSNQGVCTSIVLDEPVLNYEGIPIEGRYR